MADHMDEVESTALLAQSEVGEQEDEHYSLDYDYECRFGWGRFRPDFLQRFNKPRWLVIFSASLFLVTSISDLSIATTSLERRFHFTSTQLAMLYVPGHIVGMFATPIVSYYSDRGNKVKWVTYTSLLVAANYLLHFLVRYIVPRFNDVPMDVTNSTSVQHTSMCSMHSSTTQECATSEQSLRSSNLAWYLFLSGSILSGIGYGTHGSTILTYVDDNVAPADSLFYNSIVLGSGGLSVIFSIGLGGYFLTLDEDFDRPDVALRPRRSDANWIGAWWLLPLIAGVCTLLGLIPYSGLPQRLPGGGHRGRAGGGRKGRRDKRSKETVHQNGNEHIGVCATVKTVFSTPVFVFATIRQILEAAILSGFAVFMPKYLESLFGFSTQASTIIPGIIGIIPGMIGGLVGGAVCARMNLTLRGLYTMAFLSTLVAFSFSIPFLLPCPTPSFVGVNVPYETRSTVHGIGITGLDNACNQRCHCSKAIYDPYCGPAGATYYSPCYAGCESLTNCTCLPRRMDSPVPVVYPGRCNNDCKWRPLLFCVALAFNTFIGSTSGILITQSNMRAVPFNMRTTAIGMQAVLVELLGGIPGTPVFGKIFDHFCVLWKEVCSEKASCIIYDTFPVAYSIAGYCLFIKIGQLTSLFLAMRSSSSTSLRQGLKDYLSGTKWSRYVRWL